MKDQLTSTLTVGMALALSSQMAVAENWVGQECYDYRPSTPYVATNSGSVETEELVEAYIPCISQTGYGSTEPTLAITRDGTIFYSPAFTNDGVGLIVSHDDGVTWDMQIPRFPDGEDHSRVQSFMYMDPETERLFYHSSKTQIFPPKFEDGFNMTWSEDKGETWNYTDIESNGFDWAKVYAGNPVTSETDGYPNVLYMSSPTPISTPAWLTWPKSQEVLKSIDGGQSWELTGSISLSVGEYNCPISEWVIMGNGVVAPNGDVFIGFRRCNQFSVAKSVNEGADWTVIDVPGGELIDYYFITQVGLSNANYVIGEPVAMDEEGNLYVLWPDLDDLPRMSVSRDGGETWSEPVVVSAPDVKRIQYASIEVNEPGQVGVAYYGTTSGYGIGYDGFMAMTENAFAEQPIFTGSTANELEEPLYPYGFNPGYLAMFFGGDLNEIIQVQFSPSGDMFASFNKAMCVNQFGMFCKWDLDENAGSVYQGVLGRLKKM
jgi:hypothetical protein